MSARQPTLLEALIPIVAVLLFLGVGYGYLQLRVEALLICSAIVASLVGKRVGLTWAQMQTAIIAKIADALPALLILLSVGFLVGAWMFSGTVPLLVYYGLQLIEPRFLLATAFIITIVVSTATGTSWGAIGTVGVALMGIAGGLGVSLPATAGAVISGAYFGDKISPFSDTTNLAPIAAGSELYEHIRHLLYTTVPPAIIALILYVIVGLQGSGDVRDLESVQSILTVLDGMYQLHPILLLPVAFVFYGAIARWPTIPTMIAGGFLGVLLGVALHGFAVADGMESVIEGFKISMADNSGLDSSGALANVTRLLERGGMTSMTGPVLLVFCAFAYAGIVNAIGCLDVILARVLRAIRDSEPGVILATMGSSMTVAMVTGDAYLAIIIPGDLFRSVYPERGLHPKNLSRTLEDSGTVIMPLIPWAVSAAYASENLGVATLDYLPWAVFCYLGPLFAVFYAFTGIGIARMTPMSEGTVPAQASPVAADQP